MLFIGDLPVEPVYPRLKQEIVSQEFPLRLRVVIRMTAEMASTAILHWTAYAQTSGGPRTTLAKIQFQPTSVAGNEFAASLEIREPGAVVLVPSASQSDARSNFEFKVLGPKSLEESVNRLLNDPEHRGSGALEIRSN